MQRPWVDHLESPSVRDPRKQLHIDILLATHTLAKISTGELLSRIWNKWRKKERKEGKKGAGGRKGERVGGRQELEGKERNLKSLIISRHLLDNVYITSFNKIQF